MGNVGIRADGGLGAIMQDIAFLVGDARCQWTPKTNVGALFQGGDTGKQDLCVRGGN